MSKASGKFVVRIPPSLHERIRRRARETSRSLNEICHLLLEKVDHEMDEDARLREKVVNEATKEFGSDFLALILFGSRARGDSTDSSDTDLLIVLDGAIPVRRDLYRKWTTMLPQNISIHFSHLPQTAKSAGSLWLECALDGEILYGVDARVSRMLGRIRDRITSGQVVRKLTHGQAFWIEQ